MIASLFLSLSYFSPLSCLSSLSPFLTQVGDKLGVMRVPEFSGSLIIFINGVSIGIVATGVAENVYGFVELNGDCDRVSITPNNTIKLVRVFRVCSLISNHVL